MPLDWRTAYLHLARSDFEVYQRFQQNAEGVGQMQALHYLQMMTEKLAKGYLQRPGDMAPPKKTHKAFVRFVQLAARVPRLMTVCRCANQRQFARYLESLEPLAAQIENLAPALAQDGPNPEYPWMSRGAIVLPLNHSFMEFDPTSPKMIKMMRFLESCFQLVDESLEQNSSSNIE